MWPSIAAIAPNGFSTTARRRSSRRGLPAPAPSWANAAAQFLELPLIRLQCYDGLDESKVLILYALNEALSGIRSFAFSSDLIEVSEILCVILSEAAVNGID